MAERPTFSPFWHRVRQLKPRLRPHVQITRQHYRGRRWHVVHDPATNQFYRLNPIAHHLVGLLDGRRTVEQAWTMVLQSHGDEAPTQHEALQLIGQLYSSNLLSVDATPEVEQMLRRGRDRRRKKAIAQAMGIMYFKIRMFNPDAIFAWLEPILRPLLNRWGFIAWVGLLIFTLANLLPRWSDLTSQFAGVLSPGNWWLLGVVFVVTKAIHEVGHGVILKRFGGQVPEFGIMLLVLFPAPYVDASSAWALENKWKRISVGAGGMLFELFTACVAALVWLNTVEGSLANQLAYNAMFIASVSTILFNANPLMRFDGYYILSDLIEVPNLMQRSNNQLKYYFKRYPYGLKDEHLITTSAAEKWILIVYGLAAFFYRIFLFITITLFVMGKFFAIGLLLAIWTAVMWFIVPIGKFVHWLAQNPSLHDKRARAIGASIAMGAMLVVVFGAIPVPDWRRAWGAVEPAQRSGAFALADGFIIDAHVAPGQFLREGDPIATLENPQLVADLARAKAERASIRSRLASAIQRESPAVDEIDRALRNAEDRIIDTENRLAQMVIRARHDGVFVGPDPSGAIGAFIRRGQSLGDVVSAHDTRVVATLDQRENTWAIRYARGDLPVRADVRFVSDASRTAQAGIVSIVETGVLDLASPALGYTGGGDIQLEPGDQSGTRATSRQFEMRLAPEPGEQWAGAPGERVRVRFTLPAKPLLVQWTDRLHKMVQGKIRL